ncbi:Nucleolar protein 6 [Eumeta japonica]|uniref:Nucleolar protein 6 n=1 Tax=Eumeta variegata TaxID=151549 RepID=A0A4C1TXC3_EUMVA|nr:Nucleolar protein 6 [Eumeta japonica]
MSISEEDGEESLKNENGKRPAELKQDGKKRLKTKSLYRQPTVSELNRLQETQNLFNSNLFRLQVDEILQEVKVKDKTLKKFEIWFENFKKYLFLIPDKSKEYDLSEKVFFKELKVKQPLGHELKNTRLLFTFYKMSDVKIVGSYSLGCAINSKLKVDVQVTIPATTYVKSDSLNYRYHKKRAAYLAYIASYLNKSELITNLKYSWCNGCDYLPVLDFEPSGKLGNHMSMRINLVTEEEAFKLHRYSPTRNNLRENWLLLTDKVEGSDDVGPPTPYYNASILCDLTSSINNNYLHELLETSDWDTKGLSMFKGDSAPQPMTEFLKYFPVVFLDKTGYYNICWQMSQGTYNALKRESSVAVEMLDNSNLNSFTPLFMSPYNHILQFDHILRFKDMSKIKETVFEAASKESKINYGIDKLALIIRDITALLVKGLGTRAHLVVEQLDANISWSIKTNIKKAKKEGYEEKLSFGLILDAQDSLNTVEKGPPANLPEAEQFRAFWGEKSELRRFQDGSITETCVWDADSLARRRLVTKQIIAYLLKQKYGIDSEYFYIADQLDSALTCKDYAPPDGVVGTGEEITVKVLQTFDDLRKDLRALNELPLNINSVYGISSVFSYSEPFPPLPQGVSDPNPWKKSSTCLIKELKTDEKVICPPFIPVSQVVMELGHSGKWPGDLEAFRCLKTAFHLQIADRLTKQFSLPTQVYTTHLDVMKSGLVFRLEIGHSKEVTLLRKEIEKNVVKYRDTEESLELQHKAILLPRLRGALHGLHQKYPAYGPTTSLVKRWLSAHLLDDWHFPETVIELVTAYLYLRPEPYEATTQPLCGFLRTLHLLSTMDWNAEPLIVNFNNELTREQIADLEKKFNEKEADVPAVFVTTPYDGDTPSVWSRRAPSRQVLARVRLLSTSTLNYIEKSLLNDMKDNILGSFIPSLSGYDVLIRLHGHLVPHTAQRVDAVPRLRTPPALTDVIPIVQFDPVAKYLEELRGAYSQFALFFHDTYGGDVIAVLWRPDIRDHVHFQVSNANALKPININGETKYQVNIDALIGDFKLIGDGLVKEVTVNS